MKEKVKKEVVEEEIETPNEEECGFNFMELLNNPAVAAMMQSGKDIFKKEKSDPNVCEISIKAPTEVVLKLFRVDEK